MHTVTGSRWVVQCQALASKGYAGRQLQAWHRLLKGMQAGSCKLGIGFFMAHALPGTKQHILADHNDHHGDVLSRDHPCVVVHVCSCVRVLQHAQRT